jgi:peroxiredoxin family protein
MESTKVAMVINSPSYERVSYALSIAAISAAHLKEVHVLFTYGAVCRLAKGKTDDVGEETDAWIREDIINGLEKGSIQKITEMITHLKGFGGKIYACSAALTFHQLTQDNLIEETDEVTGISTFLDITEGASMLYI